MAIKLEGGWGTEDLNGLAISGGTFFSASLSSRQKERKKCYALFISL